MFERYTEPARRVLFFARFEASQVHGFTIGPEHIVLGVLRESPAAVTRFIRPGADIGTLRRSLVPAPPEVASTAVEIPFSSDAKAALARARDEADGLLNRWIAPEHLVLGVLVASSEAPARALAEAGLEPDAMREFLRKAFADTFERPEAGSHPTRVSLAAHALASAALSRVVLRQWRGVVKPGFADQYIEHLRRETLPSLSRLDGFIDCTVVRRDVDDGIEFQVTTMWRSLDSIKAFAGDEVTRAVVPPAAAALMARYDADAIHYEIVQ